jgi:hypothetical protein
MSELTITIAGRLVRVTFEDVGPAASESLDEALADLTVLAQDLHRQVLEMRAERLAAKYASAPLASNRVH